MKKSTTLFFISVIGITALFIIGQFSKEIITGKISEIKYSSGTAKIKINETEILVFTKEMLNLKKNETVELEIQEYEREFIAKKITKLKN